MDYSWISSSIWTRYFQVRNCCAALSCFTLASIAFMKNAYKIGIYDLRSDTMTREHEMFPLTPAEEEAQRQMERAAAKRDESKE